MHEGNESRILFDWRDLSTLSVKICPEKLKAKSTLCLFIQYQNNSTVCVQQYPYSFS